MTEIYLHLMCAHYLAVAHRALAGELVVVAHRANTAEDIVDRRHLVHDAVVLPLRHRLRVRGDHDGELPAFNQGRAFLPGETVVQLLLCTVGD